jgi:hypothetical protein
MSNPLPPTRYIDPRGHRFGAGLSVFLLVSAFLLNLPVVVAIIGIALGVSAWFGTRYSALGRPWPYVRKAFRLGPPAEMESELPPRFAQLIGFLVLSLAVFFFLVGLPTLGWVVTAAVAALQTLLAATGYCLGCRMYFLRWRIPGVFERLAR